MTAVCCCFAFGLMLVSPGSISLMVAYAPTFPRVTYETSVLSQPTHRTAHADELHVLPLKARAKYFEFHEIAEQPVGRIVNDHIEGPLLAERVGKQFFKTLALFQIAIGSLALINICLCYRISVAFRPFMACAEVGRDSQPGPWRSFRQRDAP